jgi:tetratricopeptide (TPR) repeat protein
MHALLLTILLAQAPVAPGQGAEERLIAQVSNLYQSEQNTRAIALLEPFVKANPGATRAKLFLALGYAREEMYEQGRVVAAEAAAGIPGDHYAHYVLALNLYGLNRFEEAEARYKRSLEIKPDFADAHFQLGQLYARQPETLDQAKTSFEKALAAGYKTVEIHKELASISSKLNQYAAAIEHANAAVSLDANYADAYFVLADALRKSGSPEQAAEAMRKFQALNASAVERKERETKSRALYAEGMTLLQKDDLTKAYAAFRTATEILPQLDAAHYRMAQLEYLGGDTPRALQSIRRALELNAFESEYYFVLARLLENSDVPGATEAAAKAASLNPDVADFHNLLGNLLSKAGDWKRALESYQRATTLDPQNEAFQANLAAAQKRVPKQ